MEASRARVPRAFEDQLSTLIELERADPSRDVDLDALEADLAVQREERRLALELQARAESFYAEYRAHEHERYARFKRALAAARSAHRHDPDALRALAELERTQRGSGSSSVFTAYRRRSRSEERAERAEPLSGGVGGAKPP